MRVVGMPTDERPDRTTSVVDFAGNWDRYLSAKPGGTRHEIRRILRRTSEHQNLTYIRHRPAPAREGDGDPSLGPLRDVRTRGPRQLAGKLDHW